MIHDWAGNIQKAYTVSCTRNGERAHAKAGSYRRRDDWNVCYLQNFEVQPGRRRAGVGTAAYRAIEAMFRRAGCREVRLLTEEEATGFWLKMGFTSEEGHRPAMSKHIR